VKLHEDLEVVEAMAAEMDEYLRSDVLFWPMVKGNLPRLTLGGYLMREHRLLALRDQLDTADQARLDAAVERYNQALVEKIVRFEARAHEELHARLRQWGEYLKDVQHDSTSARDYYPSAVESRAMIAALLEKLGLPPYQLEANVTRELDFYDRTLRNHWQPGDFVWPDSWRPAYPETAYWWLYGRPR
jgi:hypothetical protein